MNNQDKAREPSMDEILASIRKIIAEEPSEARAEGESAAGNPLLTGTELRASNPFQLDDRPRPSADRLSSALKARATAPPPPPPAARHAEPFSIASSASPDDDNDLSDLLDDPTSPFNGTLSLPEPMLHKGLNGAASPAAAKPYLNGLHVLADDDDLPPEGPAIMLENPAEDVTKRFVADVAPFSPVLAEVAAQVDAIIDAVPAEQAPAAVDETVPAVPPVPPTPAASPWDSMRRKSGFWPPQNNIGKGQVHTPSSPAAPGNAKPFPGSGAFPPPEVQRAAFSAPPVVPSAPSETAELVARLHAGLSETPIAPESHTGGPQTPPSQLQFAAPLGSGGAASVPPMNGAYYASAPPAPNGYAAPYAVPKAPDPAPIPVAPAPIPAAPPRDPYAASMSTEALMEAAFAALTATSTPSVPPRDAYGRPMASEPPQSRYADPYAPSYGLRPDHPAAAALDALAQGLAAQQRAEPPRRAYDTYQPAPSHSHTHTTALVPQPLPPAVQEYYPQAIRTLEDSVADMLKPLLQKWLADNMPRIIERALRVEAASGMKPPGSS